MSIIPPNRLKRALQAGQYVMGTMLAEIRQPSIMQLLVNAGFDFVIIDNEHGAFSIESISDLSRVARLLGLTPIVRVPDLAYPYLAQSLDAGAQGLMLPRIRTADQVRAAVQMMKYPPMGQRGCALNRGHTDFQAGAVDQAMAQANQETLLVVQIETPAAVENVEEIVTVPGVDVALVGPGDLSIGMGIPGQMDTPAFNAALEKVIATCKQHNVVAGIHINDVDIAIYWAHKGMRMVSSGSEVTMLVNGGQDITSTIRATFP